MKERRQYELVPLHPVVKQGNLIFEYAINRLKSTSLEPAGAQVFMFDTITDAESTLRKLQPLAA